MASHMVSRLVTSAGLLSLYVAAAFTANYQAMWRHESPAYVASEPSSSSMRSNWLYLARRSDLDTMYRLVW